MLFHTIAGNQEHSLSKGLFLPQPMKELVLNLSHFLYQNLHEAYNDSSESKNERFLRAYKVFVDSSEFQERLKIGDKPLSKIKLSESYLQVLKLLFEG